MSDLIDRQAAIDALTEYGNGRAVYISVEEAFRRIEQLPSAQPDKHTEERTKTHACDLIDRQAAIDIVRSECRCGEQMDLIEELKALPSAQPYTEAEIQKMQELEQAEMQKAYECGRASAQPEIIYCKDCKHRPKATRADEKVFYGFSVKFPDEKCPCYCEDGWYGWYPEDDFYCGYAERREE